MTLYESWRAPSGRGRCDRTFEPARVRVFFSPCDRVVHSIVAPCQRRAPRRVAGRQRGGLMTTVDIPGDATVRQASRIFISYKDDTEPDTSLASFLYRTLKE